MRRLFFCVLLAAFSAFGQDALLIERALLIDGSGAPPRRDAAVLIVDGRIAAVGGAGSMQVPAGVEIIDASGKTVIPGIVNLRAHFGPPPTAPQTSACCVREEALRRLGVYASFGVTTVAVSGPVPDFLAALGGGIDADEVRSAARVLAARRGFADAARGTADFVHLRIDPRSGARALPSRGYRAAIRRAKAQGAVVSVQVPRLEDAKRAVEAGADMLTQSVVDRAVDREFIDLLLKNEATYAPALTAEQAAFEYGDRAEWLYDNFFKRSIPSGITPILNSEELMRQALDPDRSRRIFFFEQAKRNLKMLAAAGARIALATGSGAAWRFEGYFEHREARLLQEAGLSPLEIVRAFSTNAAEALGIAADRGAVAAGKRADFVVLNANPVEDIRNLREIHAVFIGGRLARL